MAFTPANNKIYLVPFLWDDVQEWDQLALEVTTLEAGKVGRLGVYTMGVDGLPNMKILQTGEISLAATAIVTETISLVTVPPGVWLAFAGDSTTAELESRSSEGLLGRATATGDISKCVSETLSYSSGDDLPTDPFVSAWTHVTDDPPLLALRAV